MHRLSRLERFRQRNQELIGNETASQRHKRLNQESARNIAKQSVKAETRARNEGALRLWKLNADLSGRDWREVSDIICAEYAGWRLRTNAVGKQQPPAATTVKKDFTKIRMAFLDRREHFPVASKENMPITNRVIDGAKTATKGAAPLRRDILREIIKDLMANHAQISIDGKNKGIHPYDAHVIAFYIAFSYGCMRRSVEILRPDLRSARDIAENRIGGITAGMIRFSNNGVMTTKPTAGDDEAWIAFSQSKTNKTGKMQAAHMTCLCKNKRNPYPCPLHALKRLYSIRGSHPFRAHSKILRLWNGDTMDYAYALNITKVLTKRAGLNPRKYGTHSYRRGGVQDSMEDGEPERYVDAQGGWCSEYGKDPYQSKAFLKTQRKMRRLKKQQE